MFCEKCGVRLQESDVFCQSCGTKVLDATSQKQQETMAQTYAPLIQKPKKKRSKMSKGKKILIGFLSLLTVIVVIAGIVAINVLNDPAQKIVSNLKNQDYVTARSLYQDNFRYGNKSKLINQLNPYLDSLKDDFKNGKVTYEVAVKTLDTIDKMSITILEEKTSETREYIKLLNNSNVAFNSGSALLDEKDYVGAIKQFQFVIEDDLNYSKAQENLNQATTAYKDERINKADEYVKKEQYEEAIAEINSGLAVLPDNADLSGKLETIKSGMPIYFETIESTKYERYTGNVGDSNIMELGKARSKDTNGDTYEHGLDIWVARWNYQDELSWVWREYTLPTGYKTLSGRLGIADDCYNKSDFDTILEIIGDGKVLYSQVITPGFNPVDITLDITGVTTLRISAKDNVAKSGGTAFLLGDLRLTK